MILPKLDHLKVFKMEIENFKLILVMESTWAISILYMELKLLFSTLDKRRHVEDVTSLVSVVMEME